MDYKRTLWKELIEETKERLSKYPIEITQIYDEYSSLRIDYRWRDKDAFTREADDEIEHIILDAEEKSEMLILAEENKDKPLRKETFTFPKDKTFFGLQVYPSGVRESDIKELPFYEFWKASAVGSTCALFNGETYIYLHDWERFCYSFILHGTHRYEDTKKGNIDG